jgi:uncharacterized protein
MLRQVVSRLHSGYPAIAVYGPRQSGKTTLCRQACPDLAYVNLESPLERAAFADDPKGFLSRFAKGAILDEVQNLPEIFSYLQVHIDAGRDARWVLTGSQQVALGNEVSQSLAGRVALLELWPFSMAELEHVLTRPTRFIDAVLKGGYPPLYDDSRTLEPVRWLEDYLATFVNRDVRQLLDVRDRSAFDRFVRLCAARTAQILNVADLARDAGVDHKTAGAWLSVLEACYLVVLVQPHHENFGKRVIKSPKLFFVDSGLACRLMNISTAEQLRLHPLWGALGETWFVGEVFKARTHRGERPGLWYWRSGDGIEVDLIIEQGNDLIPIECKVTESPLVDAAKGIRKLRLLAEARGRQRVVPGLVLYAGSEARPVKPDRFVPWTEIDAAVAETVSRIVL